MAKNPRAEAKYKFIETIKKLNSLQDWGQGQRKIFKNRIMHYYFCTLFASNYLIRGLSLYESLLKHCSDFTLWILCMDNKTYEILSRLRLAKVRLIFLKEVEDKQLFSVKKKRSLGEYCWTCTPSLMLYLFKKQPEIQLLTYLDADLFFYSSPQPLYEELGQDSVMLVSHHHSTEYKYLESIHGRYNVGTLIFKKDKTSLGFLRQWRKSCLGWCYGRKEYQKYGDQFYLEELKKQFDRVGVSKNIGVDVAPWNVSGYRLRKNGKNQLLVNNSPLIYYHFANVQILPFSEYKPLSEDSLFKISKKTERLVYQQYFEELARAADLIRKVEGKYYFPKRFINLMGLGVKKANLIFSAVLLKFRNLLVKLFFGFVIKTISALQWEKEAFLSFLKNRFYFLKESYYLPIPAIEDFKFLKRSELCGLNIEKDKLLGFLNKIVRKYDKEFKRFSLDRPENLGEYYVLNGSFGSIDGNVYYAILRHFKPKFVVEVGSGFSTLLAQKAIEQNRKQGQDTKYVSIDPFPKEEIIKKAGKNFRLIKKKVQEINIRFFQDLGVNDILFIDSSHVLRSGNDVFWLYCEIFPRLAPGVLIHIHDFELPNHYPETYLKRHWYWNEQYLVQAMLSHNKHYEIFWPGSFAMTKYPKTMARYFKREIEFERRKFNNSWPSSLWIRVRK